MARKASNRFVPFERSQAGAIRNYIDTSTGAVVSRRARDDILASESGRRTLAQKERDRARGFGFENTYQYNKARKVQSVKDYTLAQTKHYGYSLGDGANLSDLEKRITYHLTESGQTHGDRVQIIARMPGTEHTKGDKRGFSTPPVGIDDIEFAMSFVGDYLDKYELDASELDYWIEYIEDTD